MAAVSRRVIFVVRRLMQMWITVGFAERELDVEKLSNLKTSNSRLSCLESKAVRRSYVTAAKDYFAARVDNFKRAIFGERI